MKDKVSFPVKMVFTNVMSTHCNNLSFFTDEEDDGGTLSEGSMTSVVGRADTDDEGIERDAEPAPRRRRRRRRFTLRDVVDVRYTYFNTCLYLNDYKNAVPMRMTKCLARSNSSDLKIERIVKEKTVRTIIVYIFHTTSIDM